MERKSNRQLLLFAVLFAVVWSLLVSVQMHLARRVYLNQKELFAVKLNEAFTDIFESIDTIDYNWIDSLVLSGLHSHGITYPYDLGVYDDDSKEFIFLTDDADTEAMLEVGFQFKLLSVTDEGAHFDTIFLHFPNQVKRFRHDTIIGYLTIVVVLLLLLACFLQVFHTILKQRKLNAFREKMLHFIIHELKTPLTTINLSTQLLRDKSVVLDDSTKDSYLGMIADEAKTLQELSDEVLSVFQSTNMTQVDMAKTDLHLLLKKVCEMHEPQFKDCHAQVNLDLAAEHSLVNGNYTHLFNAFSNLIDNSIKYRQGDLRLEITTRNQDNSIEVAVADNGIGIRKENLSLIFDAFARFNTDDAYYVQGYGLGLNYVKHIIDYHKGTIMVDSELGKGAVFTVTLPIIL